MASKKKGGFWAKESDRLSSLQVLQNAPLFENICSLRRGPVLLAVTTPFPCIMYHCFVAITDSALHTISHVFCVLLHRSKPLWQHS
jgi:hypothetical protein